MPDNLVVMAIPQMVGEPTSEPNDRDFGV
jgi:hypothetical protein